MTIINLASDVLMGADDLYGSRFIFLPLELFHRSTETSIADKSASWLLQAHVMDEARK
jgi:hypothetical protein